MPQQRVYTVRLPKWLVDALDRKAVEHGTTRSELIRRILETYILYNKPLDRHGPEYKRVRLHS